MYDKRFNTKELVEEGKKWWPIILKYISSYEEKGCTGDELLYIFLIAGKDFVYSKEDAKSFYSYIMDKLKDIKIIAKIVEDDWCGDPCWNIYAPIDSIKRARNKLNA